MVDIDYVRSEAFNFLQRSPGFARSVLELLEELYKTRMQVSALNELRDQDRMIMAGLVDIFHAADEFCITMEKYTEGKATEEEVFEKLQDWQKARVVKV